MRSQLFFELPTLKIHLGSFTVFDPELASQPDCQTLRHLPPSKSILRVCSEHTLHPITALTITLKGNLILTSVQCVSETKHVKYKPSLVTTKYITLLT